LIDENTNNSTNRGTVAKVQREFGPDICSGPVQHLSPVTLQLFVDKADKGCWVVVLPPNDGDAFDTFTLRDHLERQHGIKNIATLKCKNVHGSSLNNGQVGMLAAAQGSSGESPFVLHVETTQQTQNGNRKSKRPATPGVTPRTRPSRQEKKLTRTFINSIEDQKLWTFFECEWTTGADGSVIPGNFISYANQRDDVKNA